MKKSIIFISIMCVLGVIAIVLFVEFYGNPRPHSGGPDSLCIHQLSSLGKSIAIYALDHNKEYPSTFEKLAPNYAEITRLYRCPARGVQSYSITNITAWSDYILIPHVEGASPMLVHAFCTSGKHKRGMIPVLFVDGSVMWMMPPELKEKLKQQGLSQYWNPRPN